MEAFVSIRTYIYKQRYVFFKLIYTYSVTHVLFSFLKVCLKTIVRTCIVIAIKVWE